MLVDMGMSPETATTATEEIHRDENRALNFHLVQELGVDPSEKPSPWVAAGSSFLMFAIGAVIPLIPYLLGFASLWAGLACGGVGLLVAGGVAARFTRKPRCGRARVSSWRSAAIAIAATYFVGHADRDGGRLSGWSLPTVTRGGLVGQLVEFGFLGRRCRVRCRRVAASTTAPSSTAAGADPERQVHADPSRRARPASHGATAAPPKRMKL